MPARLDYLESQVMTATPYQLHMMVIDGAIRHSVAGETALREKDLRKSRTALSKAREFVVELLSSLDDSRQPEIVANLRSLFIFVNQCLVRADLRRDADAARDAIQILRLHRQTWIALGARLQQANAVSDARPAAESSVSLSLSG
jgi:flagellar secretion chaperone FliS